MNKSFTYPDPFASNSEKTSRTYGLSYARYIQLEWLSNGQLDARNLKFKEQQDFKNNKVDSGKYKDMLGMCQERVWTGMNWKFTPIAPKFVNVVKDGFSYDLFKIRTKAVDSASRQERDSYKKTLEDEMLTAGFTRQMSVLTGVDFSPAYTPASKEEIDIHMQLKYKQPREIASEMIINRIFQLNGQGETMNAIAEDLITNGIGAAKVLSDNEYGVVINRVAPCDIIYSYDTKTSRNKKGTYYFGEKKACTVDEIIRLSDGEISKEELRKYMSVGNKHDNNDNLIDVLYFCFKTTLDKTYLLSEKKIDNEKNPAKGKIEVWFEGNYIVDSGLIWGYRLMEDMIRPSNDVTKVMPPYAVYQLSVPSIVENIIPFCEDAHIAVLKLRHLILTARPKGIQINIDAISNLDLGGGDILTPAQVLEIYDQTGRLLVSSKKFDEEDQGIVQAFRDINTSMSTDLIQLINAYNQAINMCYEVSGINRVRDGSAPVSGALVGTQQIALSMSNTATKHILEGLLNIEKNVAEIALNRAQQDAMINKSFPFEIMESFLGENDKVQKELMSSHKYKFDVIVDVAPDQYEKQSLQSNVFAALQNGQITLSDSIDIQNIDNIKLANEYLKITISKRIKEKQQNEIQIIREKENARAQADIAIKQANIQELQAQAQLVQIKAQSQIAVNNSKIEKETEAQIIILGKEHKNKMQQIALSVRSTENLNQFKEDSKDKRTKIQADQQSKLIFQRQNGTAPETFTQPSPVYAPVSAIPEINMEDINSEIQVDENGQPINTTQYATQERTVQQPL